MDIEQLVRLLERLDLIVEELRKLNETMATQASRPKKRGTRAS